VERPETDWVMDDQPKSPDIIDPPPGDWTRAIARQPAPVAVPAVAARRRRRFRFGPWFNVLLFMATCITVATMRLPSNNLEGLVDAVQHHPRTLLSGVPFTVALMSILLAHEMGHYLTARRYGVQQSLPFFIPAPNLLGTMGALIFLRSPPPNRRILLAIAVMGPYAGLILAVPLLAWGLAHSAVSLSAAPGSIELGSSLLVSAMRALFAPADTVVLHPVAQAGWYGLFITSLNLMPSGQLDGGHVVYALFAKGHRTISTGVAIALLVCGGLLVTLPQLAGARISGSVWTAWALMLVIFGMRHPRVEHEETQLTYAQRINGWFALAVFVLTFMPVPFKVV
jgi:membrane-associated protease RseP (regulator of RpoE activity)